MKEKPRAAFVFPARHKSACVADTITQLSRNEPVFKNVLEQCDAEIVKRLRWSILDKLDDIQQNRCQEYAHFTPILTATQIALSEVLRFRGITPDAVLGICAGEFAAGYIAGALNMADAIELACRGSYVISRRSGRGKGIIVALTQPEVEALRSGAPNEFYFGAALTQKKCYLSCESEVQASLLAYFKERGVVCEGGRGEYGFHSPLTEVWRETFLKPLAKNNGSGWPRIPYYSPVVRGKADNQMLDETHWWDAVRKPLLIPSVYLDMIDDGFEMFLDIGNPTHLSPCLHEMASVRQKKVANVFFMSPEGPAYRVFRRTCNVLARQGIGASRKENWITNIFRRRSVKSEQQ